MKRKTYIPESNLMFLNLQDISWITRVCLFTCKAPLQLHLTHQCLQPMVELEVVLMGEMGVMVVGLEAMADEWETLVKVVTVAVMVALVVELVGWMQEEYILSKKFLILVQTRRRLRGF